MFVRLQGVRAAHGEVCVLGPPQHRRRVKRPARWNEGFRTSPKVVRDESDLMAEPIEAP